MTQNLENTMCIKLNSEFRLDSVEVQNNKHQGEAILMSLSKT